MYQQYYGVIELTLVFGSVLAFAIWQLRGLSPSKSDDAPTDSNAPGHAVGEHPLDEG